MAVVLIVLMAGCGAQSISGISEAPVDSVQNTPQEINEEVVAGANFYVDAIYGVFRNSETGEDDVQIIGQHNYYNETTAEELADNLSWFTELNFAVSITEDDLGTAVEWLPESTIFDTEAVTAVLFDDDGNKITHKFDSNNALRWFMLDSLAETLRPQVYALHYTMDGGKDLVLEGLTPIDTFPADEIYEGQP